LAILPGTVDKKFMISNAIEYEVVDTWYDRDFINDTPPAQLIVIRSIKGLLTQEYYGTMINKECTFHLYNLH